MGLRNGLLGLAVLLFAFILAAFTLAHVAGQQYQVHHDVGPRARQPQLPLTGNHHGNHHGNPNNGIHNGNHGTEVQPPCGLFNVFCWISKAFSPHGQT